MPLLSIPEAAALRQTTRYSVHRWIRAGMPAQRLGNRWLIERADVLAYTPREAGNPTFARPKPKPRPRKRPRN